MHEIRRAYRHLARQHHPDISRQPRDGEYFTALTTAYEVLHDPDNAVATTRLATLPIRGTVGLPARGGARAGLSLTPQRAR